MKKFVWTLVVKFDLRHFRPKNMSRRLKIVTDQRQKFFRTLVVKFEFRHFRPKNVSRPLKIVTDQKQKFFRTLVAILNEYRHVTHFAQNGVPTLKNSA